MKVSVDTGGTFTDIIFLEEEVLKYYKVPSNPKNPALSIIEGLKSLSFETLIHGTTVATNAFLERKGGKFLLLTTKGFEDVIFIGRQVRPKLYDFFVEKPPHFLTEEEVLGVSERIGPKGEIIKPLTEEEIKRVLKEIEKRGLLNIALSFLHSYINPLHEKLFERALRESFPKVEISVSSDILPEFREYERTSTTAINAYLLPVLKKYLNTLEKVFPEKEIFIQQSNGGFITLDEAKRYAVHTILSGPAGGAYGGLIFAKSFGFERVITFDMGGTSTDVCLLDGALPFTKEYQIDGFPIGISVINIYTVGAGGGSIAYVDVGGALKVGPISAGADPGPACYGKSLLPTVTDANLLLGRLLPDKFYGGKIRLDKERSFKAISELAGKIGLSPLETALGIIKIANTHMSKAISKVSVEKGFDPKEFILLCFGGAGGLHACSLARELGILKILVPKFAGAFSAFGLYFANYLKDFSKTIFVDLKDIEKLSFYLDQLRKMAQEYYQKRERSLEEFEMEYLVDLRYKGQGYEITIPYTEDLKEAFERAHERLYGYLLKNYPIEVVTLRLRVRKSTPFEEFRLEEKTSSFSTFEGEVFTEEGVKKVKIISWEVLREGEILKGPALLIENFTTFYLEEDFVLKVLKNKTLLVERWRD